MIPTRNDSRPSLRTPEHWLQYILKLDAVDKVLLSLYGIILVVGFLINVVLLLVIMRNRVPKSLFNRRMLITRTVCDLSIVWVVIPYNMYRLYLKYWNLGLFLCCAANYATHFLVSMNNLSLVAICLNRSMAMSQLNRPSNSKCCPNNVSCRIRVIVLFSLAVSLCISIPAGMYQHLRVPPIIIHTFGENAPKQCTDTMDEKFRTVYEICLIVTIFIIPMIIICSSQHVVTKHLKRSQQLMLYMGREDLNNWSRRRQRIIRLCMLMTVLFVVSWIPKHFCNVYSTLSGSNLRVLSEFSNCAAFSNVISNPIMLLLTCSSYRKYIKRNILNKISPCTSDSSGKRLGSPSYCDGRTSTQARPASQRQTLSVNRKSSALGLSRIEQRNKPANRDCV